MIRPTNPAALAGLVPAAQGPLERAVAALPSIGKLALIGFALSLALTRDLLKLSEYENRSVCIPHIHDTKPHAELLKISGADLVLRPEISATEQELRRMLDKIASASFVLTGALHAAIIACAYGRPFAFWDNGHVDIPFKWWDFASSVCVFVRNVNEGRRSYRDAITPRMRISPECAAPAWRQQSAPPPPANTWDSLAMIS